MALTIIAIVAVNDADPMALGEYFGITLPLLERARARIIKRFMLSRALPGKRPAEMALVIEYPDRAALDMVLQSAEYRSAKALREQAFHSYEILVGVGDDPPSIGVETTG